MSEYLATVLTSSLRLNTHYFSKVGDQVRVRVSLRVSLRVRVKVG